MIKCKNCNGKGYVFEATKIKWRGFNTWLEPQKEQCRKCFGKGHK